MKLDYLELHECLFDVKGTFHEIYDHVDEKDFVQFAEDNVGSALTYLTPDSNMLTKLLIGGFAMGWNAHKKVVTSDE